MLACSTFIHHPIYNTFSVVYLVIHDVSVGDDHRRRVLISEWSPSIEHLISTDANRPPVRVLIELTLTTVRSLLQPHQHFGTQIVRRANRHVRLLVHTSNTSVFSKQTASQSRKELTRAHWTVWSHMAGDAPYLCEELPNIKSYKPPSLFYLLADNEPNSLHLNETRENM